MSRAIQIKVSESVTRTIHVDDEVRTGLEILKIMPPEISQSNLESVLQEHGFEQDEDGNWVRQDDDVTIRVDPETQEVSVSVDHEEEVTEQGNATARGYDDTENSSNVKRAKENLRGSLEKKLEEKKQNKQNELTKKLEKSLEGIRGELREIGKQTNIKNLKQKAASMGEVKEQSESPNGDLTIRVKL